MCRLSVRNAGGVVYKREEASMKEFFQFIAGLVIVGAMIVSSAENYDRAAVFALCSIAFAVLACSENNHD